MLVHFPVALWPAHTVLHLFAGSLPEGAADSVGFWLLAVGTSIGWLAAVCGLADFVRITADTDREKALLAACHMGVNGFVLTGFTALAVREYFYREPAGHSSGVLLIEAGLLLSMFVGNFLGGQIVWKAQ